MGTGAVTGLCPAPRLLPPRTLTPTSCPVCILTSPAHSRTRPRRPHPQARRPGAARRGAGLALKAAAAPEEVGPVRPALLTTSGCSRLLTGPAREAAANQGAAFGPCPYMDGGSAEGLGRGRRRGVAGEGRRGRMSPPSPGPRRREGRGDGPARPTPLRGGVGAELMTLVCDAMPDLSPPQV